MRMVLAAAFLLLFLQPARAGAAGQSVESSASPVFEFHSGFWVNLHHFLYLQGRLERARAQSETADGKIAAPFDNPASLEGMTADEKRAWQAAVRTYADSWSSRDLLLSNQMVLINDRLAELEDCPDLTGRSAVECTSGIVPELVTALDEAAPIYRRRWWPEQDKMNRAWIAALAPPLRSMGEEMAMRLADTYQSRWPARIHVDVVGFAGGEGAYTSVAPVHLMISSQDSRNEGMAGFETLFYEASHVIAGGIAYTIGQECRRLEKPIPRNLWNALLLFTAREVMRRNWPDIHQLRSELVARDPRRQSRMGRLRASAGRRLAGLSERQGGYGRSHPAYRSQHIAGLLFSEVSCGESGLARKRKYARLSPARIRPPSD